MIECDDLNTGETVGNAVVPLGTLDRRCLAVGANVEFIEASNPQCLPLVEESLLHEGYHRFIWNIVYQKVSH